MSIHRLKEYLQEYFLLLNTREVLSQFEEVHRVSNCHSISGEQLSRRIGSKGNQSILSRL